MPQTNTEPQWILTTNQSYTPKSSLQLGQILTDYTNPNSAILTETAAIADDKVKEESYDQNVNYKSSEPIQTAFEDWLEAASSACEELWMVTGLRIVGKKREFAKVSEIKLLVALKWTEMVVWPNSRFMHHYMLSVEVFAH
ncbi:hypothetical protein TRIATDRAFT_279030 [Trichoderma atroviride IMI 206040]|uniref:Uncharacterized protein n=1 Tax=Hypocrea atroviridis (strain ATCC 20476 / IMI 206040) TaxID=452589 RepID=G9P9R0_HYPAI|nr:uncharacterized protein TRIATDRAFT_279030 [Trichoderma atroviride IMI 206040]EHK40382.1 hypothetical protein TRIATDRAFT_279030 [Trichoderma atroviride IMI 206040]